MAENKIAAETGTSTANQTSNQEKSSSSLLNPKRRIPDAPPVMVEYALRYARRGFYVIPIWWPLPDGTCACGNKDPGHEKNIGKHPAISSGQKAATIDEDLIREWWTQLPDANIGLCLEPSGLIAFDIDNYAKLGKAGIPGIRGNDNPTDIDRLASLQMLLGLLPKTLTQISGSRKGFHQIFRSPGFPIVGEIGGITMRSPNYIVAAPSLHKSGGRYSGAYEGAFIGSQPTEGFPVGLSEREPAELPQKWKDALKRDPKIELENADIPDEEDEPAWLASIPVADRIAAMKAHLDLEKGEVMGETPKLTFNITRTLVRGFAIRDPEVVLDALSGYNERCKPNYKPYKLAEIVSNVYDKAVLPSWGSALVEKGALARHAPETTKTDAVIRISTNQMHVTDEAEKSLMVRGNVYVRAQKIVTVIRDKGASNWIDRPEGSPAISELGDERLRELLGNSAKWEKYDERSGKWKPAMVPIWVVQTLKQRKEWALPPLEGVVDSPVLRPDGTILDVPGYDPATRLIYDPCGVVFPSIPEAPTHGDAVRALDTLMEPFSDFPFAAAYDRTAVAALILTAIARSAIDGHTPLFASDANTPGSGKTLAVDVVATIVTGKTAPRVLPTESDDETRKRMLAFALASPQYVLVDNVTGDFGSAQIAAAITGKELTERTLGKSEAPTLSMRWIWVITGNNIGYKNDLARRVVRFTIDPKLERPENRDGFRHPDLLSYVSGIRPALVVAALTLLRAFVVAGRPAHGKAAFGSFENWDRLVRGAIIWAGGADPLLGRDSVRATSDADTIQIGTLLAAWEGMFGDVPKTLADAVDAVAPGGTDQLAERKALRAALMPFNVRNKVPHPQLDAGVLGYAFRKLKGRIVNGRLFHAVDHHLGVRWSVDRR